jgi:hypothetical protein
LVENPWPPPREVNDKENVALVLSFNPEEMDDVYGGRD